MLGQQLASSGEHFFPEGEICLSPGEIRLLPVQGQLHLLKVFLGEGDVAGLALELLLPFLQPFHGLDLLGPLGSQSLVQSTQLGLVLCREGLPTLLVTASSLLATFLSLRIASSSLAHTLWRSFLYSLRSRSSWDCSEVNYRDVVLVRSSGWVRQSLRRWCSASSASHSRKIAASVSLRTWWARDSMRGRGTGIASCSAPDRSRCPNTTSISSRAGGGLELNVPPVSPLVSGVGANPPIGTSSATTTPPNAGTTPAESLARAWEAASTVLVAAGSGPPAPPLVDSCY
jgi:hypothetical protein